MRRYLLTGGDSRLSTSGRRNIEGENNCILSNDVDLSRVEFNIQGSHNLILIHPQVYFNQASFNIYGNRQKIVIGAACSFNGPASIWAEDENCLISIGRGSTFEGVHLSATEPNSRLIIGQDCMFSYDIDVRTGDSHSIISKATGERLNYAKDVVFGDHVWVASHCIFTKGARVGSGSVVGTGSLVNRKYSQENVVLAGRPAKVIRKEIEWLRERVYDREQAPLNLDTRSTVGIEQSNSNTVAIDSARRINQKKFNVG